MAGYDKLNRGIAELPRPVPTPTTRIAVQEKFETHRGVKRRAGYAILQQWTDGKWRQLPALPDGAEVVGDR